MVGADSDPAEPHPQATAESVVAHNELDRKQQNMQVPTGTETKKNMSSFH